jgi:deoxyribodipyrimidine photolyase
VGSLRDALARRGARLVVREGPWERVVPAVVAEVGAVEVVTEDEVEHR